MALTVITHVYNEEFMMPFWLAHHLPIFDHGIILDYDSTDRTREICQEMAPHWEFRTSRNREFAAIPCDQEVMAVEQEVEGWKVALNTTEFIFHANLREALTAREAGPRNIAFGLPAVVMADRKEDRGRTIDPDTLLFLQCRYGFVDRVPSARNPRWIHRMPHGAYCAGRHRTSHPTQILPDAYHLWYGWAPFDQIKARKMQVQTRIPLWDRKLGHGIQHFVDNTQIELNFTCTTQHVVDLWQDPDYRRVLDQIMEESGQILP